MLRDLLLDGWAPADVAAGTLSASSMGWRLAQWFAQVMPTRAPRPSPLATNERVPCGALSAGRFTRLIGSAQAFPAIRQMHAHGGTRAFGVAPRNCFENALVLKIDERDVRFRIGFRDPR